GVRDAAARLGVDLEPHSVPQACSEHLPFGPGGVGHLDPGSLAGAGQDGIDHGGQSVSVRTGRARHQARAATSVYPPISRTAPKAGTEVRYSSHTSAYSCQHRRSRRDAAIATMPGRTTRERTRAALPVASVTAMITINHTVAAIPATASGSSQDSTRDSRDASPARRRWTRVWGGDVVMQGTSRGPDGTSGHPRPT